MIAFNDNDNKGGKKNKTKLLPRLLTRPVMARFEDYKTNTVTFYLLFVVKGGEELTNFLTKFEN